MTAIRLICPRKSFLVYLHCLVWIASAQAQPFAVQDSAYRLLSGDDYSSLLLNDSPLIGTGQSLDRNIDFGLAKKDWYGIVVRLAPGDRHEEQFCIDNTSLDSVLIYEQERPGILPAANTKDGHPTMIYQERYRGGNAVPYNTSRQFVWHTFGVQRADSARIFLVLLKAAGQNINVTIELLSDQALEKRHIAYERLIFLYLGCVGFIGLCSLISYGLLRQRMLLYYLAYIFCTAGWIIAHYGYAYALVFPFWPALNAVIKPVMSLLAVFFVIALIVDLVPRIVERSWLRDILKSLQIMSLVFAVVSLIRLGVDLPVSLVLLLHTGWHVVLLGSILILIGMLLPLAKGMWR